MRKGVLDVIPKSFLDCLCYVRLDLCLYFCPSKRFYLKILKFTVDVLQNKILNSTETMNQTDKPAISLKKKMFVDDFTFYSKCPNIVSRPQQRKLSRRGYQSTRYV